MTPLSALKLSVPLWCVALGGCGGFGQVNQGQVIAYQRDAGIVTLIADSNFRDPAHPRFDVLPPVVIRVPENSREMGPEPEAGRLLMLDSRNQRAVVFQPGDGSFLTVEYKLISEQSGVRPVDARVSKNKLPAVDRTNGTITTYSPRERRLITFSVPEEYRAWPDDAWKFGDEIRYYYKDPGRALRLMNVSKTDLNKAGE